MQAITPSNAKTLWLDQALADQPPAIRAKVLDFALKFGVGAQDDDFWILIAAIGFLHSIIETAPQEWDATLSGHTQTLNQWTTSNLEVLQALTIKTETDATQAELTRELSHTLRALTKLLHGQQQHISKLKQTSTTSESSLGDLRQSLNYRLNEITRLIETTLSQMNQNNASRSSRTTTDSATPYRAAKHLTNIGRWNGSLIPLGLTALIIFSVGLLWQGQHRQTQTMEWLIYRVNQADCARGALPSGSQLCSDIE